MKLQMKLRTRLFLGFSALMTVALLGLLLALVSVMQMAKSQEQLIRDNFSIIEINQQLRQTLGNHLIVMLTDDNRSEALAPLRRVAPTLFRRLVTERNARWAATLDARLKGRGRTVVVVGVGHLIGPEGLPERLRALGYSVKGP